MSFTIAYLTCRKDCRIEWFFDSLHREVGGNYNGINLLVIDFWCQVMDGWTQEDVSRRKDAISSKAYRPIAHSPPKPSVWQGPFRLTKRDYFAASNMRNTALCLCPDDYVVFVDDLSVLMPGWMDGMMSGLKIGKVAALGLFRKVCQLEVDKGSVVKCNDHPLGHDSRENHVQGSEPIRVDGGWMFGSSMAIPVEALLEINGFDEDCDSMSGEDYIAGLMLEQLGLGLYLCPRMLTYESEELHFVETPMRRIIKPWLDRGDAHHESRPQYKDCSHAILDWVKSGKRPRAPNYQNMAKTRDIVLCGGAFPIVQDPQHDWRDGQPLREMNQ